MRVLLVGQSRYTDLINCLVHFLRSNFSTAEIIHIFDDVAAVALDTIDQFNSYQYVIVIHEDAILSFININRKNTIIAATAENNYMAKMARAHNNAKVLCLPAMFLERSSIEGMVYTFLTTSFEEGRHASRVKMLETLANRGSNIGSSYNNSIKRTIAVGSDHAGFRYKELLKKYITELDYEYIDCGTYDSSSTNYPKYAVKVAEEILTLKAKLGILLCGSGIGIAIAANRIKGIKAVVSHNIQRVYKARQKYDSNILALGAEMICEEPDVFRGLIHTFINT